MKLTIPTGTVTYSDEKITIDLSRYMTDAWDNLSEVEQKNILMNLMQDIDTIISDSFNTLQEQANGPI